MDYNNQGGYVPAKPDNNLIWAILSTCFCCLPTGIYAIIRSSQVDSLYAQGLYNEAIKAADDAKKWSIYGVVGYFTQIIIVIILYVIYFGLILGAGALSGGF